MMQFRTPVARGIGARPLAILVIVVGLAMPAAIVVPMTGPAVTAVAAKDDDDEDRNRGHGNDDDGVDEDNPGRGHGPKRGNDDNRGRGRGDKGENDRGREQVAPVATFVVEIACPYDAAIDRTTCTFAGQGATAGLRGIGVPVDAVCAEVVGGDYERGGVPGGPADLAEGYSSRSGEVELVLILDGEVSQGVPVNYWVATDRGTFPAEGPSLGCPEESLALEPVPAVTVTAESVGHGVVEVWALGCGEERPPDPADFDWYGRCQDPVAGATFELARQEADDLVVVGEAEVDDEGAARFTGLAPGTYTLDETTGIWCHAESDNVNERGEVVVEAGARATVWTFHCGAADSR